MKQVDNSIYETYGDRWYTAHDDPIALLRAETNAKFPWILERLKRRWGTRSLTILDVGCGGGFLSNRLALQGHRVTGLDMSPESLRVAQRHDMTSNVKYVEGDAYQLPFADASFDAVTAMDFLEHVERPADVVRECARVLKPGGLFFYHTFNRNLISWLIVIKLVEWVVKNTPKDMHILRLFIKPSELAKFCADAGLQVKAVTGLRPEFSSITFESLRTGVVPEDLRFKTTPSTLLSYLGVAEKPTASAPGPTYV